MILPINTVSITSLLAIIAGVIWYLGWGVTYGVWADIGIYSPTVVLVLGGTFGLLLTFFKDKEE